MSSATSSETSHDVLTQARKAGLARWKLETLTGLLGIRSMTHHQSETEKNQRAENAAVRRKLWGSQGNEGGGSEGDMAGSTILGDVTHPAPVIIAGGQQSSGLAKTLAGLAIGALIPTAGVGGFLASQLVDRVPALQQLQQPPSSTTVIQNTPEQPERVDVGLGKIEDYLKATQDE